MRFALQLLIVVAFGAPSLAMGAGFNQNYVVRVGDIYSNGYLDIYLEHRPKFVFVDVGGVATPIATTKREMSEFVLVNQGNGTFAINSNLSSSDVASARQWPIDGEVQLIPRDINIDGYIDLTLGGVSEALTSNPGLIYDQIVYSPTASTAAPTIVRSIDANLIKVGLELYEWVGNPNYFHENADVREVSITTWVPIALLQYWGWTYGGLPILDDPYDPFTTPDLCFFEYCSFTYYGWEVLAELPVSVLDYSEFSLSALRIASQFGAGSEILYGDENSVTPQAAQVIAVMDAMLGTYYGRPSASLPQIAIPIPVPPIPGGVRTDEAEELGYLLLSGLASLITTIADLERPTASWFFHYTTPFGCQGIASSGVINPSSTTGVTWLTTMVFGTPQAAQRSLALENTPGCFFAVKRHWVPNLVGPTVAGPRYGQPGGGIQYTTNLPIYLIWPYRAPMYFSGWGIQ